MKARKSLIAQRGSIRVWDAVVAGAIAGSLAVGAYIIRQDRATRPAENCMEWRQDAYETRELCQQDHPQYSCLDRDAATGQWLGTTYAKNICANGTSQGGGGGVGSGGSSQGLYNNAPDSPRASRSVSRGGFGGWHGSGGG
jgi:hypothetical protein